MIRTFIIVIFLVFTLSSCTSKSTKSAETNENIYYGDNFILSQNTEKEDNNFESQDKDFSQTNIPESDSSNVSNATPEDHLNENGSKGVNSTLNQNAEKQENNSESPAKDNGQTSVPKSSPNKVSSTSVEDLVLKLVSKSCIILYSDTKWIYYCGKDESSGSLDMGPVTLYRKSIKDQSVTVVDHNLYVVDGWSNRSFNNNINSYILINNDLYYCSNGNLSRVTIGDSTPEILHKSIVGYFVNYNNKLYFVKPEDRFLYSLNLINNQTTKELDFAQCGIIGINGEKLFLSIKECVYLMNLDTKQLTMVETNESYILNAFSYQNGKSAYYVTIADQKLKIKKLNMVTNEITAINTDSNQNTLLFADENWVYYIAVKIFGGYMDDDESKFIADHNEISFRKASLKGTGEVTLMNYFTDCDKIVYKDDKYFYFVKGNSFGRVDSVGNKEMIYDNIEQ